MSNKSIEIAKGAWGGYLSRFVEVLRASWAAVAAYALAVAALGTVCVAWLPKVCVGILTGQTMTRGDLLALAAIALLVVAGTAAEAVCYSCGISVRAGRATGRWLGFDKLLALRSLRCAGGLALALLPVAAVVCVALWFMRHAVADPAGHPASLLVLAVGLVLVGLLLLPLYPLALDYMREPSKPFWRTVLGGWPRMVPRLGRITAVSLTLGLGILFVGVMTVQPAIILTAANIQSAVGTLYGDAAGMPAHIEWLSAAALFVAGVIMAYIKMVLVFADFGLRQSPAVSGSPR